MSLCITIIQLFVEEIKAGKNFWGAVKKPFLVKIKKVPGTFFNSNSNIGQIRGEL